MENLLIFILSVSGFSWIVTRSKIFKPLREKVSHKKNIYEIAVKSTMMKCVNNNFKLKAFTFMDGLMECWGCFGFWAGIACYLIQLYGINIILYAFVGSISSLLVIGLINFLDRK